MMRVRGHTKDLQNRHENGELIPGWFIRGGPRQTSQTETHTVVDWGHSCHQHLTVQNSFELLVVLGLPPGFAVPLELIAGIFDGQPFRNLGGPELIHRSEIFLVLLRLTPPNDVSPASGVSDLQPFLLSLFGCRFRRHVGWYFHLLNILWNVSECSSATLKAARSWRLETMQADSSDNLDASDSFDKFDSSDGFAILPCFLDPVPRKERLVQIQTNYNALRRNLWSLSVLMAWEPNSANFKFPRRLPQGCKITHLRTATSRSSM